MPRSAAHTMDMRVDVEAATNSIMLLRKYRPCRKCGSERVTVRQEPSNGASVLRVACSDCGFALEAPASGAD
jgi:hypothetical protein